MVFFLCVYFFLFICEWWGDGFLREVGIGLDYYVMLDIIIDFMLVDRSIILGVGFIFGLTSCGWWGGM